MKKERNKSVPEAYLLLKRGNEILLGRRKGTGYYDGWYGTPAGHIEARELPTEAIIREAKEEIGIDIKAKDVQFVHALYRIAHDETGDRAGYFFLVEKWQGEPKIIESEKCDDLQWFNIEALPENTVNHEKWAIDYVKKGVAFSQIDKEHTFYNPTQLK